MKIGAQMYTLRAHCQEFGSFERAMERVAAMGYRTAQISGGGSFSAKDIRGVADAYGISIPLTHTSPLKIKSEPDAVIEDHRVLGAGYIGIGMMPEEYRTVGATVPGRPWDGVDRFIADYTPAAEKIAAAGMKLMYHNHAFEFERFGGEPVITRMMKGFDAAAVGFTLDVYWVAYAGADPAQWLKTLSGRVDTVHFKDMLFVNGEQRMAPAGEGNLNWDAIIDAARKAGVKWAFVEQDECYGDCPFDCLDLSLKNLMKLM